MASVPDPPNPDVDLGAIDPPGDPAVWLVAVAVLVVGVAAAVVIGRITRRVLGRTGVEPSLAMLFGRAVAWIGTGLALFYALSVLGVALGPVIGALGITGVLVALALQGILENVFAGVVLQARRPFHIGDEIATGEHRGRVIDITTRVVKLASFTGETVFVPNRDVLNDVIVNQTRPVARRLDLRVAVAYGTDLDRACRVAEEAVTGIDGVLCEPFPPRGHAEGFEESGVALEILIWHRPAELERWRIRSEAVVAVHEAFRRAGITIPFPQRTLWFPRDTTGR